MDADARFVFVARKLFAHRASMSQSLVFMFRPPIIVDPKVYRPAKGPDMFRRAAATGADDGRARFKQRLDALDHLFGRFVVNDFHIHQLGLAGVRLRHHGQVDDS